MPSRAALARHPLAIVGALITTVSAVVFIALVIAVVAGLAQQPVRRPRRLHRHSRDLRPRPAADPVGHVAAAAEAPARPERGRGLAGRGLPARQRSAARRSSIIALTAVNLVILLLAGYGTLHWMESPTFCGQVCHTPMHPQFTAWQDGAALAACACADCHIGEGARAFVHYKLVGVRQLYHVVTEPDSEADPGVSPTCGRRSRSAATVTGPNAGSGDRVRVIREYADDETNTETTTRAADARGRTRTADRARAARFTGTPTRGSRIEFVATDTERQTIPYVKVTDAQGQVREYMTEGTTPEQLAQGERRTMDCIDCHNAVAHRISPTAERAVDRRDRRGPDQPHSAVRPAGRRPAREGGVPDAGRGRSRRSTRDCGRSTRRTAARVDSARARPGGRDAAGRCIGATCFPP